MKEKILAAIKAKFPTAKLSAKRLDALCATIEAKAGTDETLIDPALDALNEIYPLTEIAKDDHIRSTLEGKLKATQTPKKEETTVTETEVPDDTPAWAKALVEQNKKFAEQLAAIQGEKQQSTIKQKIAEKLKDVPEVFWNKRALPAKEEELEAFIEEVNTDYGVFSQAQTDKGLASIPPPGGGTGNTKPAAIDPAIAAFVAKQTPAK